ncbi:N-acetyltransferase [Halobacillus seohaensis]|uniref:Uncharacterized N-acetyltransferase ACFQIC_05480 n=1 Tax=Halobacillus seohaensis TaxID=447421 RepID=A0ABW2ELP7_9BACI
MMTKIKVQPLLVNYKTLEEFTRFKEYGNQELAMLEDLRSNIVENDSESPFYGVYFGNALIGRMSLYRVSKKYDNYFTPPQDYLELWKLEILPDYRGKGYGKALVNFAKSFKSPIKTNPRIRSHSFWEKMNFHKAKYDVERDLGENPLIWLPSGVEEREL